MLTHDQSPTSQKDITVILLKNGGTLITELKDNKFYNPFFISMTQGTGQTASLSFFPVTVFNPSLEFIDPIPQSDVLISYKPEQRVTDAYLSTINRLSAQKLGIITPAKAENIRPNGIRRV